MFRKACKLNAPTDIALTFADYICSKNQYAHRFEQLSKETREFIEEIELVSQARVTLINTRFPKPTEYQSADFRTVVDRRGWRGQLTVVPELSSQNKRRD
jgi:adenylosuccinate synthase